MRGEIRNRPSLRSIRHRQIVAGDAGKGRYFDVSSNFVPASIDCAEESPLCTTLSSGGFKVRTVEHLLSALETAGVDNCRVEIASASGDDDRDVEVPILDGSAREWVDAIEQTGLEDAVDESGNTCDRMAPFFIHPTFVKRNDSFLLAFPSPNVSITYGINFPEVPHIGCQWFQSTVLDKSFFNAEIASARTFCVYEEVEKMQKAGLIKEGSLENAIVCRLDTHCTLIFFVTWSKQAESRNLAVIYNTQLRRLQ